MSLFAVALAAAAFTAGDIRTINAECHAPKGWLVMRRDKAVRFKPARDADFAKVDCILAKLKEHAIQNGAKVGLITDEAFPGRE